MLQFACTPTEEASCWVSYFFGAPQQVSFGLPGRKLGFVQVLLCMYSMHVLLTLAAYEMVSVENTES